MPRRPGPVTLGLAPGFLDQPPNTGAGRVHHNVVPRLYAGLARRPRRWRAPQVWLADSAADFQAEQPVVTICHGAEWLLDPQILDLSPREYWEPYLPLVERGVRAATITVVPSEYTRRALIHGWHIEPGRVVAVHHGVDGTRFRPRPGGRRLVQADLGPDRPYVLFVGVASQAKGILALREAMAALADGGYPHGLVVAGPLRALQPPEWRRQVSAEIGGRPGRLGWVEDANDDQLAPLMSEASAVCLPSVKESFGLPVLEAMACGAPVVAGARAALPEIVADAGLLCEPTAAGIAQGLRRVLDDPELAASLSRRGRERAASKTWERTAQGWSAAIQRAAALPA